MAGPLDLALPTCLNFMFSGVIWGKFPAAIAFTAVLKGLDRVRKTSSQICQAERIEVFVETYLLQNVPATRKSAKAVIPTCLGFDYGLAVDPTERHTHERATNREAVKDNEGTSYRGIVARHEIPDVCLGHLGGGSGVCGYLEINTLDMSKRTPVLRSRAFKLEKRQRAYLPRVTLTAHTDISIASHSFRSRQIAVCNGDGLRREEKGARTTAPANSAAKPERKAWAGINMHPTFSYHD
ncbi:hypothetical protein PENSPDRAFT_665895 [Peniophora sp. CONT]|nr:hypothetical protein PENSPDRAFT_665895 [Peniophora sp. CONT]